MAIDLIQKNKMKLSRRELTIAFSAFLIILVSFVFPRASYGENFWLFLFLFAVFPALVVIFLLKEPMKNFGFSWGDARTGILFSIPVIIIFILVNYYLVFHSKYGGELPIARQIVGSFTFFLLFEVFIFLPLHFFWEFFFRGFLQLGLEKKIGIFSLPLAAVLQTALYLRGGWVPALLIFFSSLAGGMIARQSRSIVYSAFSLWIISLGLDIMIIRVVHQVIS